MERSAGSCGPVRSCAVILLGTVTLLAGCSSTSSAPATHPSHSNSRSGGITGKSGYVVYWDQNEEVDFASMPSGLQGQLMPAWDLNGQMCVLPDGSGRFVGGLDPTIPNQQNPGGLKPYKEPAIGEELNQPDGSYGGRVLYVPGPYKLPGQGIGDDSPPDSKGVFNGNSTYTGCVFTHSGNLLATDIGTAQGSFPVPANGRLVEWFAPSYTSYCIVDGPTSGGVGPHHVDGNGGLSQPGMLALMENGDALLPEAGIDEVLQIDHSSLPASAADCPGGLYPQGKLHTSVFLHGSSTLLPFPSGVAFDKTCHCYAISSFFGNPSIAWFTKNGQLEPGHPSIQGETIAQLGQDPNGYNPFGLAFAPDGTLYFVDIHITCKNNVLGNGCGPADYGGRVMQVNFTNHQPSVPSVLHAGFDFPTSVTVCVPAIQLCPYPTGKIVPPASGPSENNVPAVGPSTNKPAAPGFG
jgi:hypothetical protein